MRAAPAARGGRLPISSFAMLGFEHVVANQYLLPLAVAYGAPLSAYDVAVRNLIPATIGNWIGGAVCVSAAYGLAFGTPGQALSGWAAAQQARLARAWPRRAAAASEGGAGGGRRHAPA